MIGSPLTWALLGLGCGLVLFVRGLFAYRRATAVKTIASARIASLALGETRLSGRVKAAELTLTSPVAHRPCIYYRARVTQERPSGNEEVLLDESQSTSFLVDDGSGVVRVFPRGASWDVPEGTIHDPAAALPVDRPLTPQEREAAIAALLTVHGAPAAGPDGPLLGERVDTLGLVGQSTYGYVPRGGLDVSDVLGELGGLAGLGQGGRRAHEARLEPGDDVTLIGTALRYADIDDGFEPDPALASADDPVVAADLAAAGVSGTAAASAEEAWGNAAIRGFGIGRPERRPALDPGVRQPAIEPQNAVADAGAGAVTRSARGDGRLDPLGDIEPSSLVVAAGPGRPLAIFAGRPTEAVARADLQFAIGILGALLAIGSAAATAVLLNGGGR